jgi:hypothetical protein
MIQTSGVSSSVRPGISLDCANHWANFRCSAREVFDLSLISATLLILGRLHWAMNLVTPNDRR